MKTMRMVKSILMLIPLLAVPTYTVAGGEYTLIDLGTLGGPESAGRGINDSRQVTGVSHVTDTVRHAFVWDEDKGMQDLGTLGGTDSGGIAINNYGEVGGWSDFDGDTPYHAFHYDGTVMHDLGTLGGDFSIVFSMNDNDQLVGRASLEEGYHAFLFDNDVMHDLGTLGGSVSQGSGINAQGHIVGSSLIAGDTANQAFFWDSSNGMQSIGTLGGNSSRALAINNFGQVAGTSEYSPTNNEYHVFLWDEVNGMQDLGGLDGGGGTAFAINDHAQITGDSDGRAFIWDKEKGMRDLCVVTKCIDSGWTGLTIGRDINDHGDIVGEGAINGVTHAFLAIAQEGLIVGIDVLPTKDVNTINMNNKGRLQVAVLSTSNFHAYNEVNPDSVEFGPAGAVATRYKVKDTNRDGLPDMKFYFKIRDTGIECGDTEATLIGETYEEVGFEGTDTIVTTGCGE
jgi:probable HAF family extracellular repeat protein